MTRAPTAPRSPRAASAVDHIDADITAALAVLRDKLQPADGTDEDTAMCTIEMFAVVALKLMRQTNPSKLRDIARTEEISARLDGKPECLGVLAGRAAA